MRGSTEAAALAASGAPVTAANRIQANSVDKFRQHWQRPLTRVDAFDRIRPGLVRLHPKAPVRGGRSSPPDDVVLAEAKAAAYGHVSDPI